MYSQGIFFSLLLFTESFSKVTMFLINSSENANVLNPCQEWTNIVFHHTMVLSQKVKGRNNFIEMLLDMQALTMN